ncbi:MAG: T9SS type A sorting domain-containing protein [Ignavibacteriales bacterium]|nr:T9SS type A sorting domain-containing protein [Ignavibacteriales bacterium]
MKSLLMFFLLATFFSFSTYVDAQWIRQTNGLPEDWGIGWAIDASDSNNALISTNTGLFKTTDGGDSWTKVDLPDTIIETVVDVSISDESNFWIATDLGKIIATTNAGDNWSIQFDDESLTQFMNYIEMFDESNGVAMGDAPFTFANKPAVFLITSDGGSTWVKSNDTTFIDVWSGDTWRRLDFTDPMHGYFYESGINPEKLFKTSDGCASWIEANYSGSCSVLKCFNEEIILLQSMACNPQCVGTIHKTTDGGGTWTESHSGDGWGNDFEFMPGDASKVFFTDYDNLFFSSDTGNTWISIFVDTTELKLRDIVFTDSNHGWILGDNGKLFKTNSGGVITGLNESENLPIEFSLSQNYPNPFNPTTSIQYQVSSSSRVTLKVYDILGNEAANLVNAQKPAGKYKVKFDATNLASGVYLYRMQVNPVSGAGGFTETKKMVVLK